MLHTINITGGITMEGIIGTNAVVQIGFIVRDIEETKRKFAEFLGLSIPDCIDGGDYTITGTVVDGQPAPEANCLMAFFNLSSGLQLELIQPNGVKSTWQDFLNEKGEGIHHIAFDVKGMDQHLTKCEQLGMSCVQRGKYSSGDGEYAYLDARSSLKCFIELLESYNA